MNLVKNAEYIYPNENNAYTFDFSSAVWATNQLKEIYHEAGVSLSDADFIVETEDTVFIIEYKNACIKNAVNPEAFKPFDSKPTQKIAYKFYDTWIYLQAIGKHKPLQYIYVVEFPHSDSVMRSRLQVNISKLLPFKLQVLPEISSNSKLLESFDVLSIEEWNIRYPYFPINKV